MLIFWKLIDGRINRLDEYFFLKLKLIKRHINQHHINNIKDKKMLSEILYSIDKIFKTYQEALNFHVELCFISCFVQNSIFWEDLVISVLFYFLLFYIKIIHTSIETKLMKLLTDFILYNTSVVQLDYNLKQDPSFFFSLKLSLNHNQIWFGFKFKSDLLLIRLEVFNFNF